MPFLVTFIMKTKNLKVKQGGRVVTNLLMQVESITKAFVDLAKDKDANTSSDANLLLNAICCFEFVLCIVVLKIILSNVNALGRYLQSSSMDVISASKMADGTITALQSCCNDKNFDILWKVAENTSNKTRIIISTKFWFKEVAASRIRCHQDAFKLWLENHARL